MTDELDPAVCCIKECDRPAQALNLCGAHYRRMRLFGGPLATRNGRRVFRGKTAPQRFEIQAIKGDGCWGWRGGLDVDGYPAFNAVFDGVQYKRGHRYSYAAHTGEHPGELSVMHSCDNPTCTNPEHLSLGTTADNMADKIAKGRHRTHRGQAAYNARLTDEQAWAIFADPRPYRAIAEEYGVHVQTISSLKNGYTWKHIDAPAVKGKRPSPRKGVSDKITPEIVREIRTSTEQGKVLAERYGVSQPTITGIRKRRSWAHVE